MEIMMAITLEEALRQGKVKIGDYIGYKPISGRCVLTEEPTGWQKDQVFETEDLGWKLDKIDESLILIASRPTKILLYLRGEIGYNNGIGAMTTLFESCYSNPQFSQKVVHITEELQQKMSRCNIINEFYWFGSSWSTTNHNGTYHGLHAMHWERILRITLYSSCAHYPLYGCYGVRPVVYLKPSILLGYGGGTEEKPWQIFSPI